ncbi:MAG: hypothetical protein CMP51_01660 [Flavobacteriales bacterium]|nr:hypothetical protein [Flavobacteriales bacterium]
MRLFFILFLFISLNCISQSKKDYRNYQEILDLIQDDYLEEAYLKADVLFNKTNGWKKINLLYSSICFEKNEFKRSVDYFFKYYNDHNPTNLNSIVLFAKSLYKMGAYEQSMYCFKICQNLDNNFNSIYSKYIENCRFSISSMLKPKKCISVNLGGNINSQYAEYLPFISADGNRLYFTRRCPDNINTFQEDFYYSDLSSNGVWQQAKGMQINSSLNEGAITISSDGKIIAFASCDRGDSKGSCDIYISRKNVDNSWSNPINLEVVNSRYWDSQPVFSPDGKSMYFVSNRRGGVGGKDIWISDISNNRFSKPYNLGQKINTQNDEMSPFLHHDNLTFYFASDGHIGMGDFDLFMCTRDNSYDIWSLPINLGYPINSHLNENSLVVSPDGKTAFFTSNKDGYGKEDIFQMVLPEDIRANELSELEINIINRPKGEEIVLSNILFEFDSYVLNKNSYVELEYLLKYMYRNLDFSIIIEGHTDNIGGPVHNQNLSENRAKSVYNYLINNGVDSTRVSYIGYGDTRPLMKNDSKEGRVLNRRTSFVVQ